MEQTLAGSQPLVGRPIKQALTAGQFRPDRLPGLMSVFSRLPKELGDELKAIVYVLPRIRLLDVSTVTFAEATNVPVGAAVSALWSERWKHHAYYAADEALTALYLEIAAGSELPFGVASLSRPVNSAECQLLEVLSRRVSRALSNAFSIIFDVSFEIKSTSGKLDIEHQIRPLTPSIVARLEFDWLGNTGILSIVLPLTALDSVRELLENGPAVDPHAEQAAAQSEWSRQLLDELAKAFVTVNVVLEERLIELSSVQSMAVGTTLPLVCDSMSVVRLDAEENPVFWCELGRSDNRLTVKVERPYDPSEEEGQAI